MHSVHTPHAVASLFVLVTAAGACGDVAEPADYDTVSANAAATCAPPYTVKPYAGGDRVQNQGVVYECKPYPYSGWCGLGGPYEPGVGFAWRDAWTQVSSCTTGSGGSGGTGTSGGSTGKGGSGGTGGTGTSSGGSAGKGGSGGPGGSNVPNDVLDKGWTIDNSSYVLHDCKCGTRSSNVDGVWTFWAKTGDPQPYAGSGPRSEMRWQNNYSSGQRMFEADVYSSSGSEYTTFQIFGSNRGATATLLTVKGNALVRDDNPNFVLAPNFRGWVRLNVIHDVSTHMIHVYINRVHKASFADRGPPTNTGYYYFKNGVYGQPDMTGYIEGKFKNIRIYKK